MNGKIVGGVYERQKFVKLFKQYRKNGLIDKYISIFEDEIDRLIEIWTDAGRLVRPLINLQEYDLNHKKMTEVLEKYKFD